jgi:hypothetical protein
MPFHVRFNENADGTQLLTPLVLTARDLIVGQSPEYLMYYFWIMLMYSFVFSWDWYFLPNFIPVIVERMMHDN